MTSTFAGTRLAAGSGSGLGSSDADMPMPAANTTPATTRLGRTMPLPNLSPEQRAAAPEKAAAARKARAELRERLKSKGTTVGDVLKQGETDEVIGKMRVSAVLESLPGGAGLRRVVRACRAGRVAVDHAPRRVQETADQQ